MKGMLAEIGQPWEDLPRFFTHGTFVRRQRRLVNPEDLVGIPEKYRPSEPIVRTVVEKWEPPGELSLDDFTFQ